MSIITRVISLLVLANTISYFKEISVVFRVQSFDTHIDEVVSHKFQRLCLCKIITLHVRNLSGTFFIRL